MTNMHYDHQLPRPTLAQYVEVVNMAEGVVNQHAICDARIVNLALAFLMLHDDYKPFLAQRATPASDPVPDFVPLTNHEQVERERALDELDAEHPTNCHCYDCEPTFSKRYVNDVARPVVHVKDVFDLTKELATEFGYSLQQWEMGDSVKLSGLLRTILRRISSAPTLPASNS